MTITVKVHSDARPEMEAWVRSLNPDPTRRRELAALYYGEIKSELIRHEGRPPGAQRLRIGQPEI